MSVDARIVNPDDTCGVCGRSDEPYGAEVNITYNLSPMLAEAGFTWASLKTMSAREAGHHTLAVLDEMAKDPKRWRAMDPPNGWGSYDDCLQVRLREWALECLKAGPDARVSVT